MRKFQMIAGDETAGGFFLKIFTLHAFIFVSRVIRRTAVNKFGHCFGITNTEKGNFASPLDLSIVTENEFCTFQILNVTFFHGHGLRQQSRVAAIGSATAELQLHCN